MNNLNITKNLRAKSGAGFTIIELIVVIVIIAVLSGVVMFNVSQYMSKSRDAKRISDLDNIRKAIEMYRADYGVYPLCNGSALCTSTGGYGNLANWTEILPYLAKIPIDPINTRYNYGYYYGRGYKFSTTRIGGLCYSGNGTATNYFILGTRLENTNNSECPNWDNNYINYYPYQQ